VAPAALGEPTHTVVKGLLDALTKTTDEAALSDVSSHAASSGPRSVSPNRPRLRSSSHDAMAQNINEPSTALVEERFRRGVAPDLTPERAALRPGLTDAEEQRSTKVLNWSVGGCWSAVRTTDTLTGRSG